MKLLLHSFLYRPILSFIYLQVLVECFIFPIVHLTQARSSSFQSRDFTALAFADLHAFDRYYSFLKCYYFTVVKLFLRRKCGVLSSAIFFVLHLLVVLSLLSFYLNILNHFESYLTHLRIVSTFRLYIRVTCI